MRNEGVSCTSVSGPRPRSAGSGTATSSSEGWGSAWRSTSAVAKMRGTKMTWMATFNGAVWYAP